MKSQNSKILDHLQEEIDNLGWKRMTFIGSGR